MAWAKSPFWLVEMFDACLPQSAGVERRKMFGYPAAFVNGNMFAGLFEDSAMARLPPGSRAELEAGGAKPFEPMPGRPMQAYLTFPETVLEDEAEMSRLLADAFRFTAAMPAKVKAPRKVTSRSPRSSARP